MSANALTEMATAGAATVAGAPWPSARSGAVRSSAVSASPLSGRPPPEPCPTPPSDGFDYFNRVHETEEVRKLLLHDPTGILVLLGPKNSGKTAFVKHVLVKNPTLVGLKRPALYINARKTPITSASLLKKAIVACSRRLWDIVEGAADAVAATASAMSKVSLTTVFCNVEVNRDDPNVDSLDTVKILSWVEERLLMEQAAGDPAPVIIIDEANDLMEWQGKNLQELNQFLKFCVQASYYPPFPFQHAFSPPIGLFRFLLPPFRVKVPSFSPAGGRKGYQGERMAQEDSHHHGLVRLGLRGLALDIRCRVSPGGPRRAGCPCPEQLAPRDVRLPCSAFSPPTPSGSSWLFIFLLFASFFPAITDNFSTEVIGDFVEKDAAVYFQRLLAARTYNDAATFVLETKAWADVYGACGGNPLFLQRLADKIVNGSNLQSALDSIRQEPSAKLSSAFDVGGIDFDGSSFRLVANLILDAPSPLHAVPLAKLARALSSSSGMNTADAVKVLHAMVKHNVLALRPFSEWALDFPLTDWPQGRSRREKVGLHCAAPVVFSP